MATVIAYVDREGKVAVVRMDEKSGDEISRHVAATGLKTALCLLDKWGCRPQQQRAILNLSKTLYNKYKKDPYSAHLGQDQIDRISYLLNIHAHLRALFENPDNVYGFMAMKNHNPFFNGKSPLEIISTGSIDALNETVKQVEVLRTDQW